MVCIDNMEMPEVCGECRFCIHDEIQSPICAALRSPVTGAYKILYGLWRTSIDKECPLMDISKEEEQDG